MKRIVFWLTIAFFTFCVGVTSARILSWFDNTPTVSNATSVSAPQASLSASPAIQTPDESVDPLEAAFIDEDKLSYAGYDIERLVDANGRES